MPAPSLSRVRASKRASARVAAVVAVAAGTRALAPRLPTRSRPVANLGVALGLAALAHREGESRAQLGFTLGATARTVSLAGAVAAAVAVPIAASSRSGRLGPLFLDARVTGLSRAEAAFHLAVGIPVETAAAEEIMFRGVLLALLDRAVAPPVADALSSVLFGLWHVVPALESLASHPLGRRAAGHRAGPAAGVVATVAVTATAGLGLAWLRRRTGSLLAPIVAHAALNGAAFAAGRAAAAR